MGANLWLGRVTPGLEPGIHAVTPWPTSGILAAAPRGWPGQARP
jgi:hypothetical protein